MTRFIACLLSAGLIVSTALAEDQQQQQQQQQDQSATAQPAAARQSGQQDPTQMFIMDAYSSNLFEVQAGQLAQKQVQDPQIKRFAQMLVEDHQKANQQLKQIAQTSQVQISEQLDPVHQAKLQKMQQLQGAEFERKYINSQVAGHTMNVLEFSYQAKNAQNEQVRQFASQMLPKLQQHLDQATKLAGMTAGGAQAQPASERQAGDRSIRGTSEQSSGQGTSGGSGQTREGTSERESR